MNRDMEIKDHKNEKNRISRRRFIKLSLASGGLVASGFLAYRQWDMHYMSETEAPNLPITYPVFIAKTKSYSDDIKSKLLAGLHELGVNNKTILGKRILLKPNYVETLAGADHINTHSNVIGATIDAFLTLGASSIIVAEGSGNCRDSLLIIEETGLVDVLNSYKVPFADLNYSDCFSAANVGKFSGLPMFVLPEELRKVDIIVSMAKMKTHHWAGITLSMKNMFGVMPGSYYGWPKNVLHKIGIEQCILDIVSTVRPHFAIVDGIIGMEGDGPIMGNAKHAGVLVMGRNPAAVDATCSRIMGIDPKKVGYIAASASIFGPIDEISIIQRGETIMEVQSKFELCAHIPAIQKLVES